MLSDEIANRKILEELVLKKQMLLKQGATPNLSGSSVSLTSTPTTAQLPISTIPPISATAILPVMSDTHMINTSHRAALNNANATSCGFFVPQDSSFGNQILPVLPRFDNNGKMSVCMKLKVLEEWLQNLDGFEKPKIIYEQYATPSHIASCMAHTIQATFEDLEGKSVCDLGAGCGMLSCGAALLQAALVVGIEIDPDALNIFSQNVEYLELNNVNAICCDISTDITNRFYKKFDTVIMNPPFGTKKNSGLDLMFLNEAQKIAISSIYSLHKTSTRSHIMKKAKEWGLKPKVVAELRYDLPSTYKFHKKASVDIAVDFWRFEINDDNN